MASRSLDSGLFFLHSGSYRPALLLSRLVSSHKARCVVLFVAFCIHTLGLALMPSIPQLWYAVLPLSLTRVGEGLYGSMIVSLLSYIVDRRSYQYSIIYSVYLISFTSALGISPIVCGYLVRVIGVQYLYLMWAGITLITAFPTIFMWNVGVRQVTLTESSALLH